MRPVRIGAVSFLNARPLVRGLKEGVGAGRVDLVLDIPSRLADRLRDGDIDVGLIPAIELARIPGTTIVSRLAIAAEGPARSVLLVSRIAPERVRRLALDRESRTSNALAQVLLSAAQGGTMPEAGPGSGDLEADLVEFDAAVRIGDKALLEPVPEGTRAWDLGAAWVERTGLPFVFAVWAARPGVPEREVAGILHESYRIGSAKIDEIAAEFSYHGHRDPEVARDYLMTAMKYDLGERQVQGLRSFLSAAARLGLIEREPEIRIVSCDRGPDREGSRAVAHGDLP